MEWGKIFVNHISEKNSYPEYKKITTQQQKQPNSKMGKQLEQTFFKEDTQMTDIGLKRCSTSLIIKEIQIKTTATHHFTPSLQFKKNWKIITDGDSVEKLEPHVSGRNVK